jgi:molybdopterin-guanine dinucleotide biosynthesis protein MobB
MKDHIPAFGICGYGGSGKTTLIEQLLGRFVGRDLKVAVVKHGIHGPDIDREGKDSDRFFNAGADVIMRGSSQVFFRGHGTDPATLEEVLELACPYYDLILVEGHKTTPLRDKVWLLSDGEESVPPEAGEVTCVLSRDAPRVERVADLIDTRLDEVWLGTTVCAGVLVGGTASRMGRPKHLITHEGQTWLERILSVVRPCVEDVALLGKADLPENIDGEVVVLPDVPGVRGPLAGMLAAMRWRSTASWIFVACDLPLISSEAVTWLLSTRSPGVWATIPSDPEGKGIEPLLAHYDFRSRPLLESSRRPADIATASKVITPVIPSDVASAWTNANTPGDLEKITPT